MEETDQKNQISETTYRVEDQIGFLLRKAHQRASALFQSQFSEYQTTPTQFSTLCKLKDEGEISQNHLGRLTAMDPATIQGVTRRLIDRGLVQTRPDEKDRRRMLLRLTDEGQGVIDSLILKGKSVTKKTLSPLSQEEQLKLIELLNKIS